MAELSAGFGDAVDISKIDDKPERLIALAQSVNSLLDTEANFFFNRYLPRDVIPSGSSINQLKVNQSNSALKKETESVSSSKNIADPNRTRSLRYPMLSSLRLLLNLNL